MGSRTALAAALAAIVVGAGAAPAAAYDPSITSPTPGQTFATTQPTFSGTVQYDPDAEDPPTTIQLEVDGATTDNTYDQTEQTSVGPDGSWSTNAFTLPGDDQYEVQACVPNPPPDDPDCTDFVPFTVSTPTTVSVGPVAGTAQQLEQGTLKVAVACQGSAEHCGELACGMSTPPEAARALALLDSTKGAAIASGEIKGGTAVFQAGSAGVGDVIGSRLAFPLFDRLPVTVTCTAAGASASASGSLTWPKLDDHHGRSNGRGDGPVITRVVGPRRISLRSRYVDFKMYYRRLPGPRHFAASFHVPGDYIVTGCTNASCTRNHRFPKGGGVLKLHVPLAVARHDKGERFRDAASLAPLAGSLSLGFLNKKTGHSEAAVYYVTFVK